MQLVPVPLPVPVLELNVNDNPNAPFLGSAMRLVSALVPALAMVAGALVRPARFGEVTCARAAGKASSNAATVKRLRMNLFFMQF